MKYEELELLAECCDTDEIEEILREESCNNKKDNSCYIIETQMFEETGDFQSRVIEVESWNSFIEEISNRKIVERKSYFENGLYGNSLPKYCEVISLKFDNFHGSCTVKDYRGRKSRKLFYRVDK